MEPERWQQIKEVLIGLSQREESDRHVFLEQACAGDENLRDEVESLLAYEKESEDLIELPPRRMVADLLTQYESDSGPVVKPDSSDEVMIGKTVARYRILEQLGAGGMGTVYKAEDTELGRFVALKFLSGSAIESNPTNLSPDKSRYSTQAIERFRREARAASALDHPNICIVHDVDQHEGVPFIVMQFLSGQNLKQEIDGKALPTDRILDLAIQIANALDAAHKAGIVHRDIKSANILVTELGEAKVLDFGLAKLGALPLTACETVESLRKVPTQVSGDTMSRPGTALGTVAYMSPEQVRGEQVDARSDLFSLGVILYEMATGKVPFTGETVSAVFENILHGNSMSPSVLNPAVPRELDRIVRKAMEKSVELRYQSAGELRDDLKRLQTDSAEHAIHSSTIRNRWPLTLAVATVLLVAALLVGYLHFRAQPGAALTERDTLVLADFNNTTGETIFDETLKQALRAQLEQSPFLNVLSDHKTRQELSYMGRPLDTRLSADVAREVCLRSGSKAFVDGAISGLGKQYVVLLHAVNCQTGEVVGTSEEEAESREKVLRVLGDAATKLRARLGESLATIQKYDTPVEATTASLDALKSYSLGVAARDVQGEHETIPLFKRAIELDPNFAMAYAKLGNTYINFNEPTRGAAAISKAYELRERVSEPEKLYIESHYYDKVTGEADKSIEVYKLWQMTYPRDLTPYVNLGTIYGDLGQHEKDLREETEGLHLGGNSGASYSNLADAYINLNEFAKATEILNEAKVRKVEDATFPGLRYQLAFAQKDEAEMERQVAAVTGDLGTECWLLALQADTEAYHGRLTNARRYTRRAVASARHDSDEETALSYAVVGALREAEFGNWQLAKKQVGAAIAHSSGQQLLFLGALALARAGEKQKALALARELNRRFPKDTLLNGYWLPSIQAAAELHEDHPSEAIETLEEARRYELASPQLPTNVLLYPIYLRGEAYLAAGLFGKAQAEFQKIFDHPGLEGNYVLGALAHLGLGRAYAMEAGIPVVPTAAKASTEPARYDSLTRLDALTKARSAYQDFFSLWRDADGGIPILTRAQQEYRKLQ